MSAGKTRIASGVDGVGIIVAAGKGVWVGTTVGAGISVGVPPQALNMARANATRMMDLTRTGFSPKIRMAELYPSQAFYTA
jgi:hypothetical protein